MLKQFFKFSIIGVFNTLIDYAIYLILTRVFGVYFLAANFVAVLAAMTFSFFANKKWTFENRDIKIKTQYLKFGLVNLGALILNNLLVYFLVSLIGIYDLLAKLIVIIVTLNWNFWWNKYWTFRNNTIPS